MKKMMMIAGLLLAAVGVRAEVEGNPDRFPSIGINYTGAFEDGEGTAYDTGLSASQDIEISHGVLALDLRLPVSGNVTLNGAIGITGTEATANETNLLQGGKQETDGMFVNVGVRFYLK